MLELKNICFSADGKQILKDINLRIDDAKFIVITGPNGSGKSTLARIISGNLTPDSGQIILDGGFKHSRCLSVSVRGWHVRQGLHRP